MKRSEVLRAEYEAAFRRMCDARDFVVGVANDYREENPACQRCRGSGFAYDVAPHYRAVVCADCNGRRVVWPRFTSPEYEAAIEDVMRLGQASQDAHRAEAK